MTMLNSRKNSVSLKTKLFKDIKLHRVNTNPKEVEQQLRFWEMFAEKEKKMKLE